MLVLTCRRMVRLRAVSASRVSTETRKRSQGLTTTNLVAVPQATKVSSHS